LNSKLIKFSENKRLQRLKMKIDQLNFEVEWVPGKKNEEADALSRAPIHQETEEDEIDEIEKNSGSVNAINGDFEEEFDEFNEEVSDLFIKEVQEEAEKDPDYTLSPLPGLKVNKAAHG
jgi:hypothetical protein